MLNKKIFFSIFVILILLIHNIKGQVLFDMGNLRNFAYTSYGYKDGFENATIGIARRDSVKLIKQVVIGILDVSLPLPLTDKFFTKHSIRKGFQINLYKHKKNDFRIPFMFASTSIVRENKDLKYHDVTAEFSLVPGFYHKKYTIALDLRYELIAFRHKKYFQEYYNDSYAEDVNHPFNVNAKNHWETPLFSIAKVGFMAGLNLKHCVLYLKSGYERNPFVNLHLNNFLPGYVVLGFGYKFGTHPFEKPKKVKTPH